MGRFDPKWSNEHASAVVKAVLDDHLTHKETIRRGQAGELEGLPPFDMPRSTLRYYIDQERNKRLQIKADQRHDIPGSAQALLTRMLTLCERELSKLERAKSPDYTALDKLSKVITNIQKQSATVAPPLTSSPDPTQAPTPTESTDAQSMLDAMRDTQTGTTQELHGDRDTSVTVTIGEHDDTDTEQSDSPYSPHAPAEGEPMRDQLAAGV